MQAHEAPAARAGIRSPAAAACVFAIGAAAIEAVALGPTADGLYRESPVVVAAALVALAWFWLTAILTAAGAVRLAARAPRRTRALLRLGFVLAVGAAAVVYLASWGLYFRAGRFANVETLRFAAENAGTSWLWFYLLDAEGPTVRRIVGFVTAGTAAALAIARGAVRLPVALARPSWCDRTTRVAWYALALATVGGLLAVSLDRHEVRREMAIDALTNRVNPVFTLAASLRESLVDERVDADLERDALTSRPAAWAPPAPTGPLPPIVFVAVESLRHDVVFLRHQGREVTPTLNALARAGVHLTRAYAQSTHSDYSDVAVVASLYPLRTRRHHYYRASDPWPKAPIYELLRPAGYATAIVSSQNESWGGMDQFLASPSLDLFYDAARSSAPTRTPSRDTGFADAVAAGTLRAGSLDDAHTMDVAIAWIGAQARRGVPFFVGMNLQSPHFPYELGADAPRPFQPATLDFEASFLWFPRERTAEVRNAYYNAVREADRQLGRLVAALRDLGRLEDTILVVYGDNGEAFHENGSVTHAREPVEPAVRVACVLHAPRRLAPRADDYPFELVDVAPTVLGLLGWPPHPNFQGIDALAPDRPPAAHRTLFVHVHSGLARADAVLLGGRWKLQHDLQRGRIRLHDVVADPGETTDLAAERPDLARSLHATLASWRARQLAYYHYPFYYERYYPPPPPRGVLPAATYASTGGAR